MPAVGEVSFELERFEWTAADGRLVVVGRWNGVRGRRISRPALTVEAGGRRQRVSGNQISDDPWTASFEWTGEDVTGAELELGRSLVVELPPPRRRRRRGSATAEIELRAHVDELRGANAALEAELAAERKPAGRLAEVEAERDRLAAELQHDTSSAEQELAGLRLALSSLRASHAALEDELETLRGVRDERDELTGEVERLKVAAGDDAGEKSRLADTVRELRQEREVLAADLAVVREEVARLERRVAEQDQALTEAAAEAERRLKTERATTTEVHARLATAREEAQRTMVAEAEETERLRGELERTRADSERQLAAERAEVARLREELLSSESDEDPDEGARRMIERVTRDLERERATSRNLRRELDELRSEAAEERRATANGTLAMEEAPVRHVRTPEGTQRRVQAARAGAAQRVPKVPPAPWAVWATRIIAALLIVVLAIVLVVLVSAVT